MKSASPANSTMSSKRAAISFFDNPRMAPLRNTFSRPLSSGWNPAPSSSSAEIRPVTLRLPFSGMRIPARHLSSVLLPDPFEPMTPNVDPAGTSKETSLSAQNSS